MLIHRVPADVWIKPPSASPSKPKQTFKVDMRLWAMVMVLGLIWIGFNILTGGIFLSARNMFNLALQVSVVGILASGMILIIVARQIDLSVGSQIGFIGVLGGIVQTTWVTSGDPNAWWLSCVAMLAAGMVIGAIQGSLVAFAGIPSFVVTLGGLLFFRNAAYKLNDGATIAPMDSTFQILGGGPNGAIGGAASWTIGAIAITAIVLTSLKDYLRRRSTGTDSKFSISSLIGPILWIATILVFVQTMNGYMRPETEMSMGIPVPVLVLIAVTYAVSQIANKHQFGRHVFAVGGDPESAQLAGINSRWVIFKVFVLMGLLCGLASIVLTARLNAAASGSGTMMELYVIAAAVIGGTSLSGGAGTIMGGIVGALVMQSLQSGMVLVGVASPTQSMVLAGVLIAAVWLDTVWRKRSQK